MLKYLALVMVMISASVAWAQGGDSWVRDKATTGAASILDSKPNVLKINSPHVKSSKTTKGYRSKKDYGEAPLGLAWGVSAKDVKAYGINLRAVDTKSFPNSYDATYLPNPIKELPEVTLSFGDEDKLWRIISYSKPAYDDDQASKGLYLYRKYYQLLTLKYGEAKEFFKPKINSVEETIVDDKGNSDVQYTEVESAIGDKAFLKDLQSKEVELYSIFEEGKLGVSLALMVDERGKSYIVIEYRNSEIMQENYDETLKSL